jgi:hypothetical protein
MFRFTETIKGRKLQKISSSNYKNDKYYKKAVKAFNELLKQESVVASVDVFMQMGNLKKKDYENWRFGRVPYLEKVIEGNLSKISRQLRIIQLYAKDRGLKPSQSVYKKWGKGRKTKLQFSKSGKPSYEFAYSMHYVSETRKNTGKLTIPGKVEGQS